MAAFIFTWNMVAAAPDMSRTVGKDGKQKEEEKEEKGEKGDEKEEEQEKE